MIQWRLYVCMHVIQSEFDFFIVYRYRVSKKIFSVTYDHILFFGYTSPQQTLGNKQKWAGNLIADGDFNLPWEFVWVCIG